MKSTHSKNTTTQVLARKRKHNHCMYHENQMTTKVTHPLDIRSSTSPTQNPNSSPIYLLENTLHQHTAPKPPQIQTRQKKKSKRIDNSLSTTIRSQNLERRISNHQSISKHFLSSFSPLLSHSPPFIIYITPLSLPPRKKKQLTATPSD